MGATGPTGATGAFGGDAFAYTLSTTTPDADPGNGTLRFNNATYASVTKLFVDLLETGGTDVTTWLDSLNDASNPTKGTLRVYSKADATQWVAFKLTSITSATGYRK